MSAATREPGPAGAAYGPDSSFRTPILTTPSEICAWTGSPARLSAANNAADLAIREDSPIAMTIVELQRERDMPLPPGEDPSRSRTCQERVAAVRASKIARGF